MKKKYNNTKNVINENNNIILTGVSSRYDFSIKKNYTCKTPFTLMNVSVINKRSCEKKTKFIKENNKKYSIFESDSDQFLHFLFRFKIHGGKMVYTEYDGERDEDVDWETINKIKAIMDSKIK